MVHGRISTHTYTHVYIPGNRILRLSYGAAGNPGKKRYRSEKEPRLKNPSNRLSTVRETGRKLRLETKQTPSRNVSKQDVVKKKLSNRTIVDEGSDQKNSSNRCRSTGTEFIKSPVRRSRGKEIWRWKENLPKYVISKPSDVKSEVRRPDTTSTHAQKLVDLSCGHKTSSNPRRRPSKSSGIRQIDAALLGPTSNHRKLQSTERKTYR